MDSRIVEYTELMISNLTKMEEVDMDGSPDFLRFLESVAASRQNIPPFAGATSYAAVVNARSDGTDPVSVRIKGSPGSIKALRHGFPDNWTFEVGDLVSVEQLPDGWSTVVEMAATVTQGSTVQFWIQNDRGEKRLLTTVTRE
jgi:hypothetical protein